VQRSNEPINELDKPVVGLYSGVLDPKRADMQGSPVV
jgi:hypothetical protein